MSEHVWVVMSGMDCEGGSVVGVTQTAEAGMALADAEAKRPLDWSQTPTNCLFPEGVGAEWSARISSARWAEVARWEVTP